MSEAVDLKSRTEQGIRLQSAAIQPFLDDPDCIEIMLNADGWVWIDVLGSGMKKTNVRITPAEARSILNRVASSLGLNLTINTPIVEGELVTDGSRIEELIFSSDVIKVEERSTFPLPYRHRGNHSKSSDQDRTQKSCF